MTGIDDIFKAGKTAQLADGNRQPTVRGADGDLFQKTFEKVLSEKAGTSGETVHQTASGLGEINASSFNLKIREESVGAVEKNTEQLLNLMEQYAIELGDPGKTLRDIEPLVQGMKEGADILVESVKNDSSISEKIKSLAEESAVLANVEYTKFMRGDYT